MEEVNACFERIAPEWDRLRQGYFTEEVRQAVLDQALPQPWMRAADVGSGTGFLALRLAPLVAEVHCIDASPAMLEQARANLGEQRNVHFHVADGATLPLEDGTMDLAVANMYLHHILEPIVALREMARQRMLARMLRPVGQLILTDMDQHHEEWMRAEMADVWLGFSRAQVQAWLQEVGLEGVRVGSPGQT
jgi:ubiquinone/menaquinone biosynthesis C-methylase UbiE